MCFIEILKITVLEKNNVEISQWNKFVSYCIDEIHIFLQNQKVWGIAFKKFTYYDWRKIKNNATIQKET